jgi:hypothetical protein
MHIDESSLEGTLKVLDSIITKMLKLLGNGLEKHRIILCAGDQLTRSLLDKVSRLLLNMMISLLTDAYGSGFCFLLR